MFSPYRSVRGLRDRHLIALLAVGVVAACTVTSSGAKPEPVQGWTPDEQQRWYSATQGSRMLPLAWFRALEQAEAQAPFLDRPYLTQFRLLPDGANGLPVGFAIDDNDDSALSVSKLRWFANQGARERWVGLNCSACHTGEVSYAGKPIRIDGGPSLFDYQSFIEALDKAMVATRDDPAKWGRFAKAVLGQRDTPRNRTQLLGAVNRWLEWEERVEKMNDTPLRYGPGRVDAFGHIYNKVALFSGAANPTPNPADAPVSYPFLWDIYRHDKLQWNGIATNSRLKLGGSRYLDYGALGRNSGEVIGVFGDVVARPGNSLRGYHSSIWADNLIRLETQLARLRAPAWPAAFGALDDTDEKRAMLGEGRRVFGERCQSCHAPQSGTAPYKVTMVPLTANSPNGTDPWMACNAITYRTSTGRLKGTPKGYLGSGEKFGEEAAIADLLETMVKGALVGKKGQIIGQTARVFFGAGGEPRVVIEEVPDIRAEVLKACFEANSPYMAYKARPLDGIWATAPYLHNGSVPNLLELLLPAARRSSRFKVGTRDYDPQVVGYSTRDDAPGNSFTYDTSLTGNSNAGHEYGVGKLTDAERQALLHYLKSL